MKRLFEILNDIILCIRFPFLYPRNRFTGLHYNNWKIQDKLKDLWKQSMTYGLNPNNRYAPTVTNKKAYFYYKLLKFYHNYILQIFHCILLIQSLIKWK